MGKQCEKLETPSDDLYVRMNDLAVISVLHQYQRNCCTEVEDNELIMEGVEVPRPISKHVCT